MIIPRKTSVVILITLAELAWLAAFGLLFAYRGKVGELGHMRKNYLVATNQLAQWEQKMPEVSDLQKKLKIANEEKEQLRAALQLFKTQLAGASPEEVAGRLAAAEKLEKKLAELKDNIAAMQATLEEQEKAMASLNKDREELVRLRQWVATLPPNAKNLAELYVTATNRIAQLETTAKLAQAEAAQALETMRRREMGEFSVRRELTGLPSGDLRRVIFVVDRSSSMTASPAWDSAKGLVRTWLEFLPVEESAIVFFDDKIVSYPQAEYLRVRESSGKEIPENRNRLLQFFDQTRTGGGSTDMLHGLATAYKYPNPDVIVVFTDGHPRVSGHTEASFARAILDEVKQHQGIPILSVAVGSYEIEGFNTPWPKTNSAVGFLKELAKTSGGNFLAR